MKKSSILLATIAALTAGPAAAVQGPLFYECDITKRQKGVDWVSPKLGVIVTKDGQVLVTDAVTQHYFDKPMPAKIRTRGDKMIVEWNLSGITDSSSQVVPKFFYRATINTANNSVILKAKPVGFPQGWTGRGTCVLRKK